MKHKEITKKLINVRAKIRAKLNALKSDKIQVEQALQPLRHLINKSHEFSLTATKTAIKPDSVKTEQLAKQEQFTPKQNRKQELYTPKRIRKQLKFMKETATSPINFEPQFIDGNIIFEHTPNPNESYFDDDLQAGPSHERTLLETVPEESITEYLEQYDILPRTYIAGFIRDTNHEYDHHYLSHNQLTDKFRFGDSELNFNGADLIVKGKTYPGTHGLYELIFIRTPDMNVASNIDIKNFRDIVFATNAHKRNFKEKEQVAGNRSEKYRFVIKPILTALEKEHVEAEKKHKKKLRIPVRVGTSIGARLDNLILQQHNNKQIDYIHWDNPNELVNRLRVLISSQIAGNDNHTNEINSIVEELREANIIV